MNKLIELCGKLNINIDSKTAERFGKYYEMLIEKNRVMNLTAITDKDDVIIKHFVDSLSVIPVLLKLYPDNINKLKIIDVGTGAGFPGIPLKLVLPDVEIVLIDSVNKKLDFINDVISELKLENIKTVHGRAEDIARNSEHREKYDLCVSRAVANLSVLSELCIPFVKKDGYFISYKAGGSGEEINGSKPAIKIVGGKLENITDFVLPDSDIKRTFVCVKKIAPTKKIYPRKAGVPTKNPLGSI